MANTLSNGWPGGRAGGRAGEPNLLSATRDAIHRISYTLYIDTYHIYTYMLTPRLVALTTHSLEYTSDVEQATARFETAQEAAGERPGSARGASEERPGASEEASEKGPERAKALTSK